MKEILLHPGATRTRELLLLGALTALATFSLAGQTIASVVVAPPRNRAQTTLSGPTTGSGHVFPPLSAGNPLDIGHWAWRKDPSLSPREALEAVLTGLSDGPGRLESVVGDDPRERPALYATVDDIHPTEHVPQAWFEMLRDRRAEVSTILRSVGRIEVYGLERGGGRMTLGFTAGTAFVVAPSIVMTNRHVAKHFVTRDGTRFLKNPETNRESAVWVNFHATLEDAEGPVERAGLEGSCFRLSEILFLASASGRDVALFRFDDPKSLGPPPVPLQRHAPPVPVLDRPAFVCGYPAGNADFFRTPAVKRVSMGFFRGLFASSDQTGSLLYHDCSTASGSSGSPVVDLDTGRVYGLHYYGDRGANHAEPLWEIVKIPGIKRNLPPDTQKSPSVQGGQDVGLLVPRPAFLVARSGAVVMGRDKYPADLVDLAVANERLESAVQAVGKLRFSRGYLSGALVAPGIFLSASLLTESLPERAQVDFGSTFDSPEAHSFPSTLIYEDDWVSVWQVSALDGEPPPPAPVDFSSALPIGSTIGVVGYPHAGSSGVQQAVFDGPRGAKRLSPGYMVTAPSPDFSGSDGVWLAHDASTVGGSTGGPLLDLATGKIIGIHLRGSVLQGWPNGAILLSTLVARHPELLAHLQQADAVPTSRDPLTTKEQ